MRRALVLLACAVGSAGCAQAKRDWGKLAGGSATPQDVRQVAGDLGKGIEAGKAAYLEARDAFSPQQDLTPENEYWLGRSVATKILQKHDYKYRDAAALKVKRLEGLTEYVNLIGGAIAGMAMSNLRPVDRPSPLAGWHFVVLESDRINAFAAPGGFVFVTSRAVKEAKDEDELAATLAHEVAHVVRGHGLAAIQPSRFVGLSKLLFKKGSGEIAGRVNAAAGESGAGQVLSPEDIAKATEAFAGALGDLAGAIVDGNYSREMEYEADDLGMWLAAAAGYNPGAMSSFLATARTVQGDGDPGWTATHASFTERINRLQGPLANAGGPKPVPEIRRTRFAQAKKGLK